MRCNFFEQRLREGVELKKAGGRDVEFRDCFNVNLKIDFYVPSAAAIIVFLMPNPSPAQTPQNSVAAATGGERALAFDQAKAVRHFKLLPDGGAIEITANDP